ncbi:MAG: hypothetical protein IPF66_15920 [Holophagales bacterium]|nr:hypothetical protein [Holophagales bacterium]
MRRALVFIAALALAPAIGAQERPGPTTLPGGVARGGLAAQAGGIKLNRKVKAELKQDAPPRSRAPVLKGGRMRPFLEPRVSTSPPPKPRPKPAPRNP